jgi:hypothetical protein
MADVPSSDHHSSPWAQRGFILAAAFIAGLLLLGLALLLSTRGNDSTGTGTNNGRSSSPPSANAPARKDPNASVCGLPPGSQQIPAVAPQTPWELVGTMAAPTERKTFGPGIEQGKRRLCFAHSPTGALFAAVNFMAIAGRSPNDTALLRELTAEGRARDALLKEGSAPSDSSFRAQVAGFRVDAYSSDEATVDLAFRTSEQGALVHIALPLRWERGDWKTVIASEATPYAVEQLQDLSGFVPWSGA